MRYCAATLVFLLFSLATFAQEAPAELDTPEQAAGKVLAAIEAGDGSALKALAEKDVPDPWLVADELCLRGAHAAATALTGAAPRPSVNGLSAYVSSRVGKADDPEDRELLRRIEKARAAKELGWVSRTARARHNVGVSFWYQGDCKKAIQQYRQALDLKSGIKDRPQEVMTLKELARCHLKLGNHDEVLECSTRLLALGGDIYWPGEVAQATDLVLAAIKAEDRQALAAFAGKDAPDPWLVADEILARGRTDAALAYARAAARKDTEGLPAYLASDASREDPALRTVLDEAAALARTKDAQGILDRIESAGVGSGGVTTVRLLDYRAWALYTLERYGESSEAYLVEAKQSEQLGWLRRASSALYWSARSADKVPDLRVALFPREKRLEIEELRGNRPSIGHCLVSIGWTRQSLGEHAQALTFYERALTVKEELSDRAGAADTLARIAGLRWKLGETEKALECFLRELGHREKLDDQAATAAALFGVGRAYWKLEEWEKALPFYQREEKLREELDDRAGLATALRNIGLLQMNLDQRGKSRSALERSLEIREELEDRAGVAWVLKNLAALHRNSNDSARALPCLERALRLFRELGDRRGEASCLSDMGSVQLFLGAYAKALHCDERSLAIWEELGDRREVASAVNKIAGTHSTLGDLPKALSYAERYLVLQEESGDRAGVADALGHLGLYYSMISSHERALEYFDRSLAIWEQLGTPMRMIGTLRSLTILYERTGNLEKAVRIQKQAVALCDTPDGKWGLPSELWRLAGLQQAAGNHEEALACAHRALALSEEWNKPYIEVHALLMVGRASFAAGDHGEAVRYLGKAVRLGRRIRSRFALIHGLMYLARARLDAGEPVRALAAAQQGLVELESVLGGLAEDEGATGREQFADLYGVGAIAAARLDEPAEVLAFLENGRAGALLETLGSGRVARFANLPDELLQVQAEAKAAETRAREAHERALDSGNRRLIREKADALDAAMDRRREVTSRMQREAKRAAEVFYPRAALLEEIQDCMEEGTALVIYGLCLDEALALVLRPDDERVVTLGTVEDVEAACKALVCESPASDPGVALVTLGKMLVEPLKLADDIESVLVSPAGALGYVPWGALFDVPVTCVPSGTTWVLLRKEERDPGKRVLALGDPVYGARPGDRSVEVYRGADLQPLPGTREEAKAVGDVVLLGKEATESGFAEALKAERRWRAVHLACHGLLDSERPLRSSLALTPGGGEDGFLTFLDVFGLDIPADLVVLSACETARGKVAKAEGIVGLTRAFMYAGSPRILCSLWQVDDEATRALMVKFYELWNPKEGEGLPAATALKQAQDFIRNQEKWKHPIYWAAWVLWGLPD